MKTYRRDKLRRLIEAGRVGPKNPRPNCASGNTHTTGQEISAAIREQQLRALLAYPSQQRRARTDAEWEAMYKKAMAEKAIRENGHA
jgi:hypothetical protein